MSKDAPNSLRIDEVEYVRRDSIPEINPPTGEFAPYKIGQAYLIRTVTNYYVGRLVAVFPQELVICKASWIPDTGRFHNAIKTGIFNEVEPYAEGNVIIGRGTVVDVSDWTNSLPETVK